jgi:hypothetical protein
VAGDGSASCPTADDRRRRRVARHHRVVRPGQGREKRSAVARRHESTVSAAWRAKELARHRVDLARVRVEHIEADHTELSACAAVSPSSYDNIVLLAEGAAKDADARTILSRVLLEELLAAEQQPQILVELLEARNVPLLGPRPGEVIVTPEILTYVLAHIALRRELRVVFKGMFDAAGPEIAFRRFAAYDLPAGDYTFQKLGEEASARGETALGVFLVSKGSDAAQLTLNPGPTGRWRLDGEDELVVLTHDG